MTMLRSLLDALLGLERVRVHETERAMLYRDGRLAAVLTPGAHAVRARGAEIAVDRFALTERVVPARMVERVEALAKARPALVGPHLLRVETGPQEAAEVSADGVLVTLMGPEQRLWAWKDAGPWAVTRHDLTDGLRIASALAKRLRGVASERVRWVEVGTGQVAVVTVDGVHEGTLASGSHAYWNVGPKVEARLIDTRASVLEVSGQELLTEDRVTVRANLSVAYQVADPVAAVGGAASWVDVLYREAQLALRRTLGAMTLDRLLAERAEIDPEPVRKALAPLGVRVAELALKDVILPGEMRTILNRVVEAQKEAEANVIRRREETNATRSLLNTAKVMAENPVMLRLKELEALQELAGKVESLTVHSGTEGLMNDLVKLRA